ncbi:MAG: hypothetical protein IIA67_08380 [Planctomycetes bacterium]|nr:hypothetical protein [Planctomycetota bacterium]
MWCNHCQTDVPGVATLEKADAAEICCARCGRMIATKPLREDGPTHHIGISDHGSPLDGPPADSSDVSGAMLDAPPALTFDDWQLETQLERIAALAGQSSPTTPNDDGPYRKERVRIDPQHDSFGPWHPGRLTTTVGRPKKTPPPRRQSSEPRGSSLLAMGTVALGTAAFLCGAVLLGWSLVEGYAHLWSLGLPIILGGQVLLLVALVTQLERIWSEGRRTSAKIEEVDERIADLKHSTRMLGVSHGSASQAFYAHMAEGASGELLLADLKGQLDLLAVRMSQRQ